MKKEILALLLSSLFLIGVFTPNLWAYGVNITVSDQVSLFENGWYGEQEDDEVAPYAVIGQDWDLEAFLLDGRMLSIVGGFDFVNGNQGIEIGDLFIDSDGDAQYGPLAEGSGYGTTAVNNDFGYDWAIQLDMVALTYDLFQIDENSLVETVIYAQNQESNPARYLDGGTLVAENITFAYQTAITDAEIELSGGYHNVISGINLNFLGDNASAFFKIDQVCGNDNLVGAAKFQHNPIPEPATILLFGVGLLGFSHIGRKKTLG